MSTTLAPTADPVPPSSSDLKAVFTPNPAHDVEDDTDDEDAQPLLGTERTFKDSVHGLIKLSNRICKIIDTPQFQRLRHIKQLGTSYYVWPAASHNRFEHCLGVAHLAMTQIQRLQRLQPDLKITQQDVDCVTIAGLCHDLGHGPWSHVWDTMFIPKALPGKKWKHEDASEMMFDDLIKEPNVNVSPEEAHVVKALIAGDLSRCPELKGKEFLFDIVANKRNGLDVDKFDYLARDCYAIGQGENVSSERLIHSARVIDGQICYDIKDANTVYELCWSRFSLHKRIYNHKTAKAIEYMLIDAVLAAEPYLKIAEQIENPKQYVYLTDDIKLRIQSTTEPELQKARDLLYRIDTRDLYKWVEYKVYPWSVKDVCRQRITPKAIVTHAKKIIKPDNEMYELAQELDEEHVIVDLAHMHCGMKEQNPLNFVKFYSKRKPNRARHAEGGDISHIMPEVFCEVLLRVFARDPRFVAVIQLGFRQVLKAIGNAEAEEEVDLDSESEPDEPTTPKPPKRTMSRNVSRVFAPPDGAVAQGGTTSTWGHNAFTDVGNTEGRDNLPSGSGKKRGAGARSPSPPKKKGRTAK